MKFIRLTDLITDRPVLVNAENINYLIEDINGNCRLEMTSGTSVLPKEDYITIQGLLSAV
jgi:hypothetical protein